MKKILAALMIVVATSSMATTPKSTAHYEKVTGFVDGDTFRIAAKWSPWSNIHWSIRVRGVDTPEKNPALAKCALEIQRAHTASDKTAELLTKSNMLVKLTQVDADKYGGRLDALVWLADGTELGADLVKLGFAKPYTGLGPKPDWCTP